MSTELITQQETAAIQRENQTLIQKASDFRIAVAAHETAAYGVLQEIKSRLAIVEKKRTSITKPLNASLKEVNALFKTLSAPLEEADGILRRKVAEFHRKQEESARKREEELRRQAEEEARKAAELAAKKRQTEAVKEAIVEHVEARQALETKADLVRPLVGAATVVKRWTYEVEDLSQVPREYLVLDAVKVNQAVRNGVREIAGLRIFQTESVRVL